MARRRCTCDARAWESDRHRMNCRTRPLHERWVYDPALLWIGGVLIVCGFWFVVALIGNCSAGDCIWWD